MRGTIGNEKNNRATSDFSLGEMVRTELLEWDIVDIVAGSRWFRGGWGEQASRIGRSLKQASKPESMDQHCWHAVVMVIILGIFRVSFRNLFMELSWRPSACCGYGGYGPLPAPRTVRGRSKWWHLWVLPRGVRTVVTWIWDDVVHPRWIKMAVSSTFIGTVIEL